MLHVTNLINKPVAYLFHVPRKIKKKCGVTDNLLMIFEMACTVLEHLLTKLILMLIG